MATTTKGRFGVHFFRAFAAVFFVLAGCAFTEASFLAAIAAVALGYEALASADRAAQLR